MPRINFLGKGDVARHHLELPYHELALDQEKSIGQAGLRGNLIIHGDNLLALKALLPCYAQRVQCIYIDPPYNTGNERWAYNDKLNSPLFQEWYKAVVDREDQCRHDKWLCMMWPRLSLLRELLADDGVIFVSIDDNEQHHLRAMMDEIFGEDNFVANLIWRKKAGGGQDSEYFAQEHEYQLCYRKSRAFALQFRAHPINAKDYNQRKQGRPCRFVKLEKWGANALRTDRPSMFYPIRDPDGNQFYPQAPNGREGNWRSRPAALAQERLHWARNKKSGRWVPYEVLYLDEAGREKIIKERTIFYDLATTTDAAAEQKQLLGEKQLENSKPLELIMRLLRLATRKDALILDSFAGSGTTAHAALALNRADGGSRRFILVECEAYADTITAERVRRVIKGVPQAREAALREGLGGTFSFATLGQALDPEKMLTGEAMPAWETLAGYVFWIATGETLAQRPEPNNGGYVGRRNGRAVYLFYRPDAQFMQGGQALLTAERAAALAAQHAGERIIVYAVGAYLGEGDLQRLGIVFCQLPWAITRRVPMES